MDLHTTHHVEEGWDVLIVSGEIDLATAAQFERDIGAQISDGCRICLDLEAVAFMDSTGLRVLIGALRDVDKAGGELRIVAGYGAVRKLLTITGLDERLDLYPSVAAAVQS